MRKSVLSVSILFVFIYSCTKIQTTELGSSLIPPIDGVNTIDTSLTVLSISNEDEDPGRVYKSDQHVIGVINNDPLFGKTTAAAFFELKPTYYKYAFAAKQDSIIVDSVVLVLSYKGTYGYTNATQDLSVYEINQSSRFKYDSAYGTRDVIGYGNFLGERKNIDVKRLSDSVFNRFESASNQLRIPLNNAFANRILKTFDTTNAYLSDSAFRLNFAGFAVVPGASSQGGGLMRISLTDTNSKLAVYYRYPSLNGATKQDTLVNYFRFNTSGTAATSANANLITRTRGSSRVSQYLNTAKSDHVFLQTSPGTYCEVQIPDLQRFPNGIIHRANLIMYQVKDFSNPAVDDSLAAPRYLLLTAYDAAKNIKRNLPNDYVLDPSSNPNVQSFGGFLISRTDPINNADRIASYDFNLTRYVQGIVTRKDTSFNLRLYAPSNDSLLYKQPFPASLFSRLYINPSSANFIANGRVQLAGGNHPTQAIRMKLRIIYSKL